MNFSISGKTNVYGVMGYPIEHSFSPVIHNTLSQYLNNDTIYIPFKVNPDKLQEAVYGAHALNIKGINVTVPHKQNIMEYLCDIDEFAKQIGAVNTLKYEQNGYKGYNTDVYGLKMCLYKRGINLKNKNVVLLGAGGAAKSAAIMVAAEGIKNLYIINRTLNKAYSIAQNVKKYYNVHIDILPYSEIDKIDNIDLCIQTTSLGMSPDLDNTPISNKDFFKKIDIALDIIFNPWQTKFLLYAKQEGCKIINGFDMLYFQAVKSYEIWNDIQIDDDITAQVKQLLSNTISKRC